MPCNCHHDKHITWTIVLMLSMFLVSAFLLGACQTKQVPVQSSEKPTEVLPVKEERIALSWENTAEIHSERIPWSDHLAALIKKDLASFDKAQDITQFCPKYHSLDERGKVKAIGELVVAVVYYESAYSPIARMHETTMGIDPVTKLPVYSEGLLQLSYQDKQWYTWCEFDWAKDKLLSPTDPKKTILDPYINLSCGIPIMANLVRKRGSFTTNSNYWAVLKGNSKYKKISEIQARVKSKSGVCL